MITTTTGLVCYWPEMGEAKPKADIEASLGHDGKHYYLKSKVELSGQGVCFIKTLKTTDLIPAARHKAGWHEYKVTARAFEKICRKHRVSNEMLLD